MSCQNIFPRRVFRLGFFPGAGRRRGLVGDTCRLPGCFWLLGLAWLAGLSGANTTLGQSQWTLPDDPYQADLLLEKLGHRVTRNEAGAVTALQLESVDFALGDLVVFPELQDLTLSFVSEMQPSLFSGVAQLQSIRSVSILGGDVASDQVFDYLGFLPNLERLSLNYSQELRSLARLGQCRQLKSLSLVNNYELDLGTLAKSAVLPRLTELEITDENSLIDDQLAQVVVPFPHLQSLRLAAQTSLTDRGLSSLAGCSELRELSIWNCPSVTGAFLADFPNHSLRRLEWVLSGLDADSLPRFARFSELESLTLRPGMNGTQVDLGFLSDLVHLTQLDLEIPNDGNKTLSAISQIKGLRRLKLGGVNRFDEKQFEVLAELTELRELDLSGNGRLGGGAVLAAISRLTKLEKLAIPGAQLANADWTCLAALQELQSLELTSGLNLGDTHLDILSRLPSLVEFRATLGSKVTDAGLSSLGRLPRLKILSLSGVSHLTGSGFSAFSSESPLEELHLSGSRKLEPAGLESLRRFSNLKLLDLADCEIRADHLRSLRHLPALESFFANNLGLLPRDELEQCLLTWKKFKFIMGSGE